MRCQCDREDWQTDVFTLLSDEAFEEALLVSAGMQLYKIMLQSECPYDQK